MRGKPGQSKAADTARPERTDDDTLSRRRAAATIALLPADCLTEEKAAFDVLVNGVYAGHWVETNMDRTAVTWIGGELVETEPCHGDEEKVLATIRRTIPASRLPPPKYDLHLVEAAILEVAAELHPEHLSTGGLLRKIVGDPDDAREIGTGVEAIRNLRDAGLFADRTDERVEPTPTALRAVELLT